MSVDEYQSFRSRLNGSEEGDSAKIPECAVITERQRSGGNQPSITQSFNANAGNDKEFSVFALVQRKFVSHKGEYKKTDVEIQCPKIQNVIRKIIGENSLPEIRADPIVFTEPCYLLFQFRDELKTYAETMSNPRGERVSLQPLMDFMKSSKSIEELRTVQDQQLSKELVPYNHLQLLFRPGDIILGQNNHKSASQCWLVQYTRIGGVGDKGDDKDENSEEATDENEKETKKTENFIEIYALSWQFDGDMFGPCIEKLKLEHFFGLRVIRTLDYYPIKYLPENEKQSLIDEFVTRGRRWSTLADLGQWTYNGIAHVVKERSWSHKIDVVPTHVTGGIVLDPKTFKDVNPGFKTQIKHYAPNDNSDPDTAENGTISLEPIHVSSSHRRAISGKIRYPVDPKKGLELDDLKALLSPGVTPGYSLLGKFWGYFQVNDANLTPIEWKSDPVEDLQIDPKQKALISDMIKQYGSEQIRKSDIVAGKGNGLIILLHGKPGCGKTLTAELFAEQERRPLYSVSACDLGDFPWQYEEKILTIFKVAQSWKAILLFDEADIFLGQRNSRGDYRRDMLTSLFLRISEYFEGVMFLTTNRMSDFDEALESRVQIIVHYPPLGPESRAKIWEKHIKEETVPPDWHLTAVCQEFGKRYNLNGREIRNLVQASARICRQRNQPLSKDMIEDIYDLRYRHRDGIRKYLKHEVG